LPEELRLVAVGEPVRSVTVIVPPPDCTPVAGVATIAFGVM
jgi:hypothetical protein